jgi:microcystin-dependent protein
MARHYFTSTSVQAALAEDIDDTQDEFDITDATGYPEDFPFWMELDGDSFDREVVEVTDMDGLTVLCNRGASGTVAAAHSAGARVLHVITSDDANLIYDLESDMTDVLEEQSQHDIRIEILEDVVAPIGSILMWPNGTAPEGWLICDGSTYSSDTYPGLYVVLGSTTLPDFRDRFPIGVSGTKSLYGTGGAASVTLTTTELPAHSHVAPAHQHTGPSHSHSISEHAHGLASVNGGTSVGTSTTRVAQGGGSNVGLTNIGNTALGGPTSTGSSGTGNTGFAGDQATTIVGSGQAFSIQNPYYVINFIIRAV